MSNGRIAIGFVFVLSMQASQASGQLRPAYHRVVARAQLEPPNGGTASVDLIAFSDYQSSFSDPQTGFVVERQAHAHSESYGGTGGPPFHPVVTAAAESHVTVEENTGGIHYGAFSESSSVLSYYSHVRPINNSGLVWHPAVIPVIINASGHVSGWGSAAVSVQDSLSNALYFHDQADGENSLNPKPSFNRSVTVDLAPDTYLTNNLSATANSSHTLDPSIASMTSSQAEADPVYSFDQAAFDVYAAQQGQPTFLLTDFFDFEFSEGIGNTLPEPGSFGLVLLGTGAFTIRRTRSPRSTPRCQASS